MTLAPVPLTAAPPFGVTENAEPASEDCAWSRFSDQVTVTVVPSLATTALLSVGGVKSTVNERVEL